MPAGAAHAGIGESADTIGESRLAVHTWREYGCASVDLFSCSTKIDAGKILNHLQARMSARNPVRRKEVVRGQIAVPGDDATQRRPQLSPPPF
jgi:S-adenosylmethionine decarboxylase